MDYQYINETGVIVPDASAIRKKVEDFFREELGIPDIVLDNSSSIGALKEAFVLADLNTARNCAAVANQINPNQANGIWLDALMSFLDGQRRGATHTVVPRALLTGVAGTIVPKDSIVYDDSRSLEFTTSSQVILNSDGRAFVDLVSVESGAVEVSIGQLNRVGSPVLGWETVANNEPAIVGRVKESDARARRRRQSILALQSGGDYEAIVSALYDIPEVQSVYAYENNTSQPVVVDGISIKPHGGYFCIHGGASQDIGLAFSRSKNIGSTLTGTESVDVLRSDLGLENVITTYHYNRAKEVPLFVRVTVSKTNLNAQEIIPQAVKSWADGNSPTDDGLVVARDVLPFEISGAINSVEPSLAIRGIQVSKDGNTWSSDPMVIKIDEIATLNQSSVTVIIQ